MDSKEKLLELKRDIAESIERAKQNSEDLYAIELALRENLERLKELRNYPGAGDPPKQK